MAEYKYENGNYYRLSTNGNWFLVNRDKDGYLTWTQPNGLKVREEDFIAPEIISVANTPIGTRYTIGIGANGGLGHYYSFLDAANAYTQAVNRGTFSDPSENIFNDLMFDAFTGKGAVSLVGRGLSATTKIAPKMIKSVPKVAGAIWNTGKRLVTGQVTKEAAKEGVKQGLRTVGKGVLKVGPSLVAGGVAGYGVDEASIGLTGKSWGENVTEGLTNHWGFGVSPLVGEFTNPGYYLGFPIVNGSKYAIMNLNYSIPFLTNNKTLEKGFGLVLNTFGLGSGQLNIRYRNGIRDYMGNVLSKYSTIVPKPVVFSGNLLELARQRVLNNLEKLGIRNTDYVLWTTSIDDPNLLQLSKSIGFEIPSYNKGLYSNTPLVTVTMPAKTYLAHISPVQGERALFNPNSATIFHQNNGYIGDIQKLFPEFADAHEFSHAIDWVLHNRTTTIPRTGGVDIRLADSLLEGVYKNIISNFGADLSKSRSEISIPGLNYNRLKLNIVTLEYHHNPSELKARYELIRNWLGIADERPLTLTEWNLAKRYYTSSVGDNNMQEFFKLVDNPEEFIDWASRRYSTNYTGTVSGATITRLFRKDAPTAGSKYYPYIVNHDDELPGFLDMILELAGGKAPISKTTGLTSYAMPKPGSQLNPSERPEEFNGLLTTLRRLDPETITVGDLAYGLSLNLPNWNRSTYKGILKDTRDFDYDYEEHARALMYDVKAQLYKKLFAQRGGRPLTAAEFEDALWDLKPVDFQNALQRAHGGMYRRDIPLTFDIEHLDPYKDIPRIIDLLTQYKNGGKLYKKGT